MLERRDRENQAIRALLPPGKRVTLECFWVIDIQTLCHIPQKPDHKYLPCELGVVCYSLNQGIHSKFHRFIYPGRSLTLAMLQGWCGSSHRHTECCFIPVML